MHHWGNHLDPALGFGREKVCDCGPHWSLTGVFGQLGGFDPKSLVGLDPEGVTPPDCTLDPDRNAIDDETSAFTPGTNTFLGLVHAPLELYLMGLVSASELPTSFPVVLDGRFDGAVAIIAFLVGTGIGQISTSDSVGRHSPARRRPMPTSISPPPSSRSPTPPRPPISAIASSSIGRCGAPRSPLAMVRGRSPTTRGIAPP
jgi:hypothetical protein